MTETRTETVRPPSEPLPPVTVPVGPPANRQLTLPRFQAVGAPPRFAHPFESHFARLLDAYRIRWCYEPTTFLLDAHPDGTPSECFTPDFYLPDLGVYVELTSMRQALVTRKHRKLRRCRAAHPELRVVMLYQRDYHRMLGDWARLASHVDPDQPVPIDPEPRVLVARDTLSAHLDRVAGEIRQRHAASGADPLLVGLGPGGVRVAGDLVARLGADRSESRVEGISIGSRRSRGWVERQGATPLAGRRVTLVPAVVSTGLTVDFAARWLRRRGAGAVDVCPLLDRASARVVAVPLSYPALAAPIDHLVGYGLDLRPAYRDLPYVGILDAPPAGIVPG